MSEFRCKDDPEANGRRPLTGDQRYTLKFPMEDGSDMHLHMGRDGMNTFAAMISQMMVDDAEGRVESTPMYEPQGTTVEAIAQYVECDSDCLMEIVVDETKRQYGIRLLRVMANELRSKFGRAALLNSHPDEVRKIGEGQY